MPARHQRRRNRSWVLNAGRSNNTNNVDLEVNISDGSKCATYDDAARVRIYLNGTLVRNSFASAHTR